LHISVTSLERKFNLARAQGRPEGFSLTPEQDFFLDFVRLVYEKLGLPLETFANQAGVKPQTVRLWLRKVGHLPGQRAQRRLLALYEGNFEQNEQEKSQICLSTD
jgi:hypothetical protein